MKGIVSFCLFGDLPMYTVGAVRNAQVWKYGPLDVDTIFYLGDSVTDEVEKELTSAGAFTVRMKGRVEDQTATFWRYRALHLEGYDYFLSRDVDSRPSDREYTVVQQWLASGKLFHIIRDHPFHGVPILAGLFGVKAEIMPMVADLLPDELPPEFFRTVVTACRHPSVQYESNDFYQIDQWWLRLRVYPHVRNGIMAHDEFFGFERRRFRMPLPPRVGNEFIAEAFTEDEVLRLPEHRDLLTDWPARGQR